MSGVRRKGLAKRGKIFLREARWRNPRGMEREGGKTFLLGGRGVLRVDKGKDNGFLVGVSRSWM